MKSKIPVYQVISVPIGKIEPNTYNPNTVAPPEMNIAHQIHIMTASCPIMADGTGHSLVNGLINYRHGGISRQQQKQIDAIRSKYKSLEELK